MTTRVGDLEAENTVLKSDVNQLKLKVFNQDEEIPLMKNQNPFKEQLSHSNWETNYVNGMMNNEKVYSINDNRVSVRTLDLPPTSCQELKDGSRLEVMDGIYLVQNSQTRKIQAVFCQFMNANKSKIYA